MQEGTLLALSTLCAEREASRRQLVDAEAMGAIVRALDDPSPKVLLSVNACEHTTLESALM